MAKRWTKEELTFLDENRSKLSCRELAKKLGRTTNAVYCKIYGLGIHGLWRSAEWICAKKAFREIGLPESRVRCVWIKNGLKAHHIGKCVMYDPQDLIEYMRMHPDDWNARAIKDDTLFRRFDWFQEKKLTDPEPKYRWKHEDRATIAREYRKGTPIAEIGKMINRPKEDVIREANRLRDKGWDIPYAYNIVREREEAAKRRLLGI